MSAEERKQPGERLSSVDSGAPQGAAGKGKKPYRKPELSKYEQVHGIGLGGSV